jgi:hypothetical protein
LDGGFFLEEAVELLEKTLIIRALARTDGNRSAASKFTGHSRNTLQKKLTAFKLERKPPQKAKPLVRKVVVRIVNAIDLLIFDLDGTLIDSKLDLAHAVNAARAHAGMEPLENETVYSLRWRKALRR